MRPAGLCLVAGAVLAGCGPGRSGETLGANAYAVDIARAAHDAEARIEAYRRVRRAAPSAPRTPPPDPAPAPAHVAMQAPRLPDVATATYACADDSRISARFDNRAGTVTLHRGGEHVTLSQQPAASGIHYAGQGWDLRGKGGDATLSRPDAEPVACVAEDETSAILTPGADGRTALTVAGG